MPSDKRKFMEMLFAEWEKQPSMRFNQFLLNATEHHFIDPYHMDDLDLLVAVEMYNKRNPVK